LGRSTTPCLIQSGDYYFKDVDMLLMSTYQLKAAQNEQCTVVSVSRYLGCWCGDKFLNAKTTYAAS